MKFFLRRFILIIGSSNSLRSGKFILLFIIGYSRLRTVWSVNGFRLSMPAEDLRAKVESLDAQLIELSTAAQVDTDAVVVLKASLAKTEVPNDASSKEEVP